MTPLRTLFTLLGGLNILINVVKMITTEEEEEKPLYFNAICGWGCAVLYAME